MCFEYFWFNLKNTLGLHLPLRSHLCRALGLEYLCSLTLPFRNIRTANSMGLPNFREIYASFRTPEEETAISRSAFFRFVGFVASCAVIALLAEKHAPFSR